MPRRSRSRGAGRRGGRADARARVLRLVLGPLQPARDRARRTVGGDRASGPRPRLLHERRLRRGRDGDQAGPAGVDQQRRAGAHHRALAQDGLPRRRLRLPVGHGHPTAARGLRPARRRLRAPDGAVSAARPELHRHMRGRARGDHRADRPRPDRRHDRRAGAGRRRDDPAARRLLAAGLGRCSRRPRHPPDPRRDRDRLRPHRKLVRRRALGRRAGRPDRYRQGPHQRLLPDGRGPDRRPRHGAARRSPLLRTASPTTGTPPARRSRFATSTSSSARACSPGPRSRARGCCPRFARPRACRRWPRSAAWG